MARLVGEIDPWAAGEDAVTIVFDGRPRDVGAPQHVAIAFAPGGRDAADDEIARRVAADPDPASLTVVTSDRELADRVRAAGAAVVSSKGFRARLGDYPRP
jgi:uncharacterized protein YaiI (UPF0178 family)